MTPLDPSHKIRIEIPHKTTCLPAPTLFADLQWWLERSEQGATEDMTSVGSEDMSFVAEGRMMLENHITRKHLGGIHLRFSPLVQYFPDRFSKPVSLLFLSTVDGFGTLFGELWVHFFRLWGHFGRPGRVLGTTLVHPGTQTLKKHQKKHFVGPHFGIVF